jgi:UPF0755 protein
MLRIFRMLRIFEMRRIFSVSLCLCLLCASCSSPRGAPIRVIVPRGASFKTAADSLHKAGLVGAPSIFRIYARIGGKDRNIKPGTYLIERGTPWSEIIKAMHGGHALVNSITIPEGWNLNQIVPALAQALSIPVDSVQAAVRDTVLMKRVGATAGTLEGYLFPDTYAFPDGMKARAAVSEMVKGFERQWKPQWNARLSELGLTRNQVVALASIVEAEAKVPAERPVIASVYLNRMKKNMLLQADPTVQYARGRHTARLLNKDLEIDSPFNTYKYPGLPPGPIGSPGTASLIGALYPASTEFLYFVAAPDGHHEFRKTLAEHQAVTRMLRR